MENIGRNKMRLLRILDILKETDEEHPVTAKQMISKLSLYGIEAERKAVLRDINILMDYGYDILLHSDNKRGFYLTGREFEDWELKILCDAVAGAKFLTDSETKDLIEKLYKLSSSEGQKTLKAVSPLLNTVKNEAPVIRICIDGVMNAIRKEKQISFQYVYTDTDMKQKYKREGHTYIVNPYSLIWRNDKYYLIGNTEPHRNLSFYRLDRIRNFEMTDMCLLPAEELLGKNAHDQIADYVKKTIYHYSGEKISLVLQVAGYMADDLLDYFGRDIRLMPCGDTYELTVRTTESEGLYYWLLQYGEHIVIKKPQSVRDEYLRRIRTIGEKYV